MSQKKSHLVKKTKKQLSCPGPRKSKEKKKNRKKRRRGNITTQKKEKQ